jgi:hypothetical protein
MKSLFLILFMTLGVMSFSQRVITDDLNGNETVNFTSMQDAKQIQVVCTQLGGTSGGTLVLQGSPDGVNFSTISSTSGLFNFYTGDTLTITNGATWLINIEKPAFSFYRIKGAGTASDTTNVTINWSKR